MLALDIDHFKAVNDSWGHPTGDLVLKAAANACRTALREVDVLGRMGGEEFAVVLPETDGAGAMATAGRLHQALKTLQVVAPDGAAIGITVSVGVAVLERETAVEPLLARADRARYAAKRAGRDRVVMAGDGATLST